MGKAVQLRGRPQILAAFDRIGIATWALFYEQKCLFKCVGESMGDSKETLQGFLTQLERSNTTGMYELRFYEDLKDKKKIKPGLEADYAYNIMCFDSEEYPSQGMTTRREGYAMVLQELQDVKAQLAVRQQEEDQEDDEPETVSGVSNILGFFNKLLDNPDVQKKIGEVFSGFIDKLTAPPPIAITMGTSREAGTMGSIPPEQQPAQAPPMITQEQANKIQASVQVLAGIDPELGDHLEKIAELARKSPTLYKSLITMLNTFS